MVLRARAPGPESRLPEEGWNLEEDQPLSNEPCAFFRKGRWVQTRASDLESTGVQVRTGFPRAGALPYQMTGKISPPNL